MAAASLVLVVGAGVALAEVLGLGSAAPGSSAPPDDAPRVASPPELPARARPSPAKPAAAASDLQKREEQSPRPSPPPVVEAPDQAQAPSTAEVPELRADQGALTVTSNERLEVYVQGVKKGMTGEPLAVNCGYKFVRLRVSDTSPWRSEGQTVLIPCGKPISVTIQAGGDET